MKKAGLVLFILFVGVASLAGIADTTTLKPKAIYGKEAQVIVSILNNNHYSKIKFNDSLSSAVLDQYIKSLTAAGHFSSSPILNRSINTALPSMISHRQP